MAATKTLSSGVGCLANQEQLLVRSLSSPGGPAWAASGHRGSGPYAPRDLLSVLQRGCLYRDLGADYFLRANADNLRKYHVKRLQQLGYEVQLTGPAAA